MSHVRTRLVGLAATATIVLLVLGTPAILVAIGAVPSASSLDFEALRSLLTSPDDGTLALAVIGLVAWAAWIVMTASLAVEAIARVRGVATPKLTGLAMPQLAAGRLLAAAALLFIAVPVASQTWAPTPAHGAVSAPPVAESPRSAVVPRTAPHLNADTAVPPANNSTATTSAAHRSTIDYTVKRGDSLWSIARDRLGDGTRYVEIVDLNSTVLDGRPDFITPGLVLRLPNEGAEHPQGNDGESDTYVVQPGDTLSEIALAKLGDADRYPEIAAASRDTMQPDGDHLQDPNLIRPGWRLTIPGTAESEPETNTGPPPDPVSPEDVAPPVEQPPPLQPTNEPSAEPTQPAKPTVTAADVDHSDAQETSPPWLLPGLTGAGAVLAGSLLLAVRAHRRTQLRYRRPGRTIAPPPPELRAVEKTTFVAGSPIVSAIEQLDRLLRHLAASLTEVGQSMPLVTTVELAGSEVTLHLDKAAELPTPWDGTGKRWTALLDAEIPDEDQFAPYPLLVTVGQDDRGHRWLVNLESLGSVALTGDPDHAEALGRHVAAELALNPWSVLVDVDTLGLGKELAALDPLRLHHHEPDDTQFLDVLAKSLDAAHQSSIGDPDPFHALLTTGASHATEQMQKVVRLVSAQTARLGTAVVAVGAEPAFGDTPFELTGEGRLLAPALELDLIAAGLTGEEATACAAIVDVTREATVARVPTDDSGSQRWRSLTDQTGALREELTDVRSDGPAGDASLLPEPAEQYESATATTAADVEVLAPIVPENLRRTLEDADPDLDTDVAAWFDSDCPLPRLSVLGPVRARTRGDATAVTTRKPHYIEMLTFLAMHPAGVTSAQVAEAFSLKKARARTDLAVVRKWLGINPRTGRAHLPNAVDSKTAADTGVTTYQVENLLVDADLFRRLRARGQARGSAGLADYDMALRLVSGQPLGQLRDVGWSWLLDDDARIDETLACAIVDVAHTVVTDALAKGAVDLAHDAVETARQASPYDDIIRLDLVAVLKAQGHDEAAKQFLTEDICNRSDDHLGPIDLPDRQAQIVDQQGWLKASRPANH